MKKDREWMDKNQKKLGDSLLHLDAMVKPRDRRVLQLESELASLKEELA